MTEASLAALAALRTGAHFDWTLVTLLGVVVYAYSVEARAGRWNVVLLAVAFVAGELVWEIMNALLLHVSGYAAMWTVAGKSAYLLLVGLNLEIYFMFALAPLVLVNLLPADRAMKIAGLPNRLVIPLLLGLFCVGVEMVLNHWGVLAWAWPWWNRSMPLWIIVAYVTPFLVLAWAYDRFTLRAAAIAAGAAVALAAASWWLFVIQLAWA
jgi:hypothetical protein